MKHKDPNTITEEEQIKFVQSDNELANIKYINNPSEKVQLAAIKDPYSIYMYYIKNPSEEVKLAVVKQDGYTIRYIINPSETVQIKAVKNLYYDHYDNDYNDYFINIYIKSEKALELYDKLKSVNKIVT